MTEDVLREVAKKLDTLSKTLLGLCVDAEQPAAKRATEQPTRSAEEMLARYNVGRYDVLLALKHIGVTRRACALSEKATAQILAHLEIYPVQDVIVGCRMYCDKRCAAEGKRENYLYGIIRGQSIKPGTLPAPEEKKREAGY